MDQRKAVSIANNSPFGSPSTVKRESREFGAAHYVCVNANIVTARSVGQMPTITPCFHPFNHTVDNFNASEDPLISDIPLRATSILIKRTKVGLLPKNSLNQQGGFSS